MSNSKFSFIAELIQKDHQVKSRKPRKGAKFTRTKAILKKGKKTVEVKNDLGCSLDKLWTNIKFLLLEEKVPVR